MKFTKIISICILFSASLCAMVGYNKFNEPLEMIIAERKSSLEHIVELLKSKEGDFGICNKITNLIAQDPGLLSARLNGWTMLHYAAYYKRPGIVRHILENGGIFARNFKGLTPLACALYDDENECCADQEYNETVSVLLAYHHAHEDLVYRYITVSPGIIEYRIYLNSYGGNGDVKAVRALLQASFLQYWYEADQVEVNNFIGCLETKISAASPEVKQCIALIKDAYSLLIKKD